MASVKKAMINRDVKLSSADILARMLQKAEGAFKEVITPSLLLTQIANPLNIQETASLFVKHKQKTMT